ncbi:nickel pincer cofactor biosynthesis protein LarB [Natranaerofaba carboxydovora]|uniref:nickel pincer cofactor biosynthesis protein LarB n=1 Tax=Natranaerofaba carboxydovora TaxID=2742683 RepID=UPI001F134D46|nr:nickel pincer cofactor biosynthesis protein LarB [Natranaerofaba carboxydovora]UMZ74781.1 AIR carboxylase [Natranaerofaba carboxydovora]
MDQRSLKELLNEVKNGETEVEKALMALKNLDFEDLGYAKVDHHRCVRTGFPEVIYCEGKTIDQVVEIFRRLYQNNKKVLATRASEEIYHAIKEKMPEVRYNDLAKTIIYDGSLDGSLDEKDEDKVQEDIVKEEKAQEDKGLIVITAAGTSDIPVAEEAYETAKIMGNRVEKLYDVGVAGLHRLLSNQDLLYEAKVVVVVAGMEGALASVVGGLVEAPIIACPTSVGYGASFGGISALLTMLNSCAAGVSVVNIDNGFGAGYSASLINKTVS